MISPILPSKDQFASRFFTAPLLVAAALLGMADPAAAAPTYLTCEFDTGAVPIKVTLDEQTAAASVFIPSNGNSFKFSATFTADQVLFQGGDGIKYEIDRVTLRIVRSMPRYRIVDRGLCRVEKTPKRAI